MMRKIAASAFIALLPCIAFAEESSAPNPNAKPWRTAAPGKASAWKSTELLDSIVFEDVETLNDDLPQYKNKKVTVSGHVDNMIDSKSMILESGGIFDNEILVVAGPSIKDVDMEKIHEKSDVKITGMLRIMNAAQAKKEFGWSPSQARQIEGERAFLVADQIALVLED
jgi:hypothetical protein